MLDAAAREFAAHGYEDASINRILLAAGFSKGSFYYYFDDKPDLAIAVLEREASHYLDLWKELRRPTKAAEFWKEIDRLVIRGTEQLRKESQGTIDALLRIGTAMSRHPELLERLTSPTFQEATSKLLAFWKHGQDIGAVRKDISVTTLLALLQDFKLVVVKVMLPHDRAPTTEEVEAFGRVHLDMIRRISEERHEHT